MRCEQLIRGNFNWHHPRNPHIYIYSHISTCEDRLCFRIAGCYWQFVVMWPPLPANEGAVCCWQSSRSCIIAQSGEERRAGRTWRSVMQWATWRCCYSCDTWHVMAAPVYRGAQVPGPAPVTLVTAGPASVGKTALINRFCNDTFNEVNTAYLSHK